MSAVSDGDMAADEVAENSPDGSSVGITAQATDDTPDEVVTYTLSGSDLFAIDRNTGVIRVDGLLDFEEAASHTVSVTATSTDGTTSSASFTIAVLDAAEGPSGAAPVLHLSYDEADGTQTAMNMAGGADLAVSNNFDSPERIPGVRGNALRTDGFSTWVEGAVTVPGNSQLSFETWIALESYPSDRELPFSERSPSSLFNQFDTNNDRGFSFDINTWGNWSFTANINGNLVTLEAPAIFPLYEWVHVAAVVDGDIGRATLWLNGDRIADAPIPVGGTLRPATTDLIVAKSHTDRIEGIFLLNALNAAIDDTYVYDGARSEADLSSEYMNGVGSAATSGEQAIAVPERRFANDLQRPGYHALPPANWTNEPHGLVEFNGNYHMFYQRTPNGPFKTQTHWGHTVSPDFVNWVNQKNALYPELETDSAGFDMKGIWAGDVVVDNGTAYAFYTNVNHAGPFNPGIALATSADPNLENWTKMGPVIESDMVDDFRDPYLFQDGGMWHMIIGATVGGAGGLDYYTSSDLMNWTRQSAFTSVPYTDMDIGSGLWELPVFEDLGNGKHILLVNPIGGVVSKLDPTNPTRGKYWIGTWDGAQFTPDFNTPKNLDVIHGHLSPTVTRTAAGDLVAIGIVDERRNSQAQLDAGWTQLFGLPRVYGLAADDQTLTQSAAPELQTLRVAGSQRQVVSQSVLGEANIGSHDRSIEIIANVDPAATGTEYGLTIAASPGREEFTRIYYDTTSQQMVLDKTQSTLSTAGEEDFLLRGDYDEAVFGKPQTFHVFIDGSVVDVFVNDAAAFSFRIYPTRSDSTQVALYSSGAATDFTSVDVWKLANIGAPRTILTLASGAIAEGAEDGAVISVNVLNNSFLAAIDSASWTISNLPAGVSVGSVARISDTEASITLSGNATADYDIDLYAFTVEIPAADFVLAQFPEVVSGQGVVFTATAEPVTTATISTATPITEGSEDGSVIDLVLTNNTLVAALNPANWQIDNLPTGITFSLNRVDANNVQLTLAGSAELAYGSDIAITVTIDPAEFVTVDPQLFGGPATSNAITLISTNLLANLTADSNAFIAANILGSFDDPVALQSDPNFTLTGVFADPAIAAAGWNNLVNAGTAHIGGASVSTCEITGVPGDCDAPTGTITINEFMVTEDYIVFLMSGGNGMNDVGVQVLRASDDSVLANFTPNTCGSPQLSGDIDYYYFDVSDLVGEMIKLFIYDNDSGGCGFVAFDHFYQSSIPRGALAGIVTNQLTGTNVTVDVDNANAGLIPGASFEDPVDQTTNGGWVGTGAFASPADDLAWEGTARSTDMAPARVGSRAISTCEIGGAGCDAPTGTLTSPAFQVNDDFMNFLMAGGNGTAPVGVRITDNFGAVLHTFTPDSCGPSFIDGDNDWTSIDMTAIRTAFVKIEVFDDEPGGCGFVSFDHFYLAAAAWDPVPADANIPVDGGIVAITPAEEATLGFNVSLNDDAFDEVIGDFSDAQAMLASGWVATGDYMMPADAAAWQGTAGSARVGVRAASSCEMNANASGCDAPTGTLRSPPFTVNAGRPFLNFLMAGGNGTAPVGLRVLDAGTLNELAVFTPNSCGPSFIDGNNDWQTIDLTAQIGVSVIVEVFDNEAGGCGFLSVDHIHMSSSAPVLP